MCQARTIVLVLVLRDPNMYICTTRSVCNKMCTSRSVYVYTQSRT